MAQAAFADDSIQLQPAQQQAPPTPLRELAISAAWNAALQRDVHINDGRIAHVIYHGAWSHGYGPDFTDAILDFGDARLVTGDIEIHNRTSEWYEHNHHHDSRYNNVVLHVVRIDDAPEVRCLNGRIVPTAVLDIPDEALFAIDRRLPGLWAELGGSICAEHLSSEKPERILQAIHTLSDQRFHMKSARYEAELLEHGLESVLLRALCGGFGYSANRAPMEHLAELMIRYHVTEDPRLKQGEAPEPWLVGVLLGLAGFLPLAPADAHAAGILPEDQFRIERSWQGSAPGFAHDFVPAISWQTARVRPANHPAYRIMQLATLLTRTGGLTAGTLLDIVRTGNDPVRFLREESARPWHPGLGIGRATAITASVVLPIAHARAVVTEDEELEDAVMHCWTSLRHAEWTQPARQALTQVTGGPTLRGLGERGHQGLLHLHRELCTPRRCKQCPIAHAVVRDQLG